MHGSFGHQHNHDRPTSSKDGHVCPSSKASSTRLLIAALITGSFMGVEVIGGVVSGSLALISDAGHMLTDFAALTAAYIGVRISQNAQSPAAKTLPIWIAFISGLSLLLIAGWIIWEAYHRIHAPLDVLSTPMLLIAIIGLLVNFLVFKILSGGDRANLNMRGAMLHVIGDILGSVAAIIAAITIMLTGYMMIDPILSALVGLLIIVSASPLIRDSYRALKQPDSL